jgi:hypothetical protein
MRNWKMGPVPITIRVSGTPRSPTGTNLAKLIHRTNLALVVLCWVLLQDNSEQYREIVVQVGQETIKLIVPAEQEADLVAELFRATGAVNYPKHETQRDEFGDRVPENSNEEL